MRPRLTAFAVSSVVALEVLLAVLSVTTVATAAPAAAAPTDTARGASHAARAWAGRVVDSGDHQGLPFVIVDKRAAVAVVHHGNGAVAGVSAVLLGRQSGDHSLPGVGQRTQAGTLRLQDMTTPAGRFMARSGANAAGETVLWLDQNTALALHRLRPGALHAVRARALADDVPARRRLSAGCVVVPGSFFDEVVAPLLGRRGGVVYVLPEDGRWPRLEHPAG